MGDIITKLFDYSVVDEVCRDDVRDAAVRIKVRMARTAADIIDIGRDLIAVKDALGHGHFLSWIEAEFAMSENTARNFMRVADRFGDKTATIADLAPAALYALAAPSTPDEIIAEVVERSADGDAFTAADIKALKTEWAAKEKDLKSKASRADAIKSDYEQQLTDLKQKLHATRDANDTLKHELSRAQRAAPAPDADGPYFAWSAEMSRLWGRAPQDWRDMWLEQIDTPVFERTAAGR